MDNCLEVSGCVLHCERASENVQLCVCVCLCACVCLLCEVIGSHKDMEKEVCLI